ncbi:MAG TPA: transglutaminase-like domain-containing protein [Gemmataceae bacterium]|nr:transglutaminase-like domain-containing protein [Gemmataceae bacterium]
MRRLSLVSLALLASPLFADGTLKTPSLKPLDEVWEAAYVQNDRGVDVKIGHIHLTSAPVDRDGKKLIRTTKELRFEIARDSSKAEMKADVSSDEDAEGKVHAIKAKLWLGKDRVQVLDCTVIEGPKIRITADGEFKYQTEFRWDPNCVGVAGEQTLLRDRKAKPKDTFTYRYFEPQVANYVAVRVEVKDKEQVALPGGLKRELLQVIATPDPLKLKDGQKLQLPAATFWVDPVSYDTIKTQMDIAEIGVVSLIRTSKVAALAPNGQVPDLMKRQSIFLKAPVPDMHDRESIVYRVTFKGDAQPKELIATDARQTIKNANGKTFELHVTARRKPERLVAEEKVGAEFLKSNYFINSDDAKVKELAAKAVGTARDPWEKARKIEGFVRNFMRPVDYTEAMAPADHVARTASGDCTEYAMLTAAMCRAEGVPSRTAIGLVYVNNLAGKPGLAFHMWTEVFVNGQWLGLDATLGRGSIGPGHIKITDHSWDGVISFTPLLPVKGFIMANPTIEVMGK